MKPLLVGLSLAVAVAGLSSLPESAEAKRLGGGKAAGMQRQAPAQTAQQSTPPTPAQLAAPVQPASTVDRKSVV